MDWKGKGLDYFLLNNGFTEIESNSFSNDMCNIVVNNEDGCYEIANNDGGVYYTNSLLIYELIGYLTYHDYLDKNYKQ